MNNLRCADNVCSMETEARFMIPQLSENADDFNEKPFFSGAAPRPKLKSAEFNI